jgi:outer membrane murein-binding lipoprotein Lpp
VRTKKVLAIKLEEVGALKLQVSEQRVSQSAGQSLRREGEQLERDLSRAEANVEAANGREAEARAELATVRKECRWIVHT